MPDDRRHTIDVAIRPCTFGHKRPWLPRYQREEAKLQDLPAIIREALHRRYTRATQQRADLEFVPWPCLLHAQQKPPPRLGSFTVFSGAWATFALELFDDSKAMCAAAASRWKRTTRPPIYYTKPP